PEVVALLPGGGGVAPGASRRPACEPVPERPAPTVAPPRRGREGRVDGGRPRGGPPRDRHAALCPAVAHALRPQLAPAPARGPDPDACRGAGARGANGRSLRPRSDRRRRGAVGRPGQRPGVVPQWGPGCGSRPAATGSHLGQSPRVEPGRTL